MPFIDSVLMGCCNWTLLEDFCDGQALNCRVQVIWESWQRVSAGSCIPCFTLDGLLRCHVHLVRRKPDEA